MLNRGDWVFNTLFARADHLLLLLLHLRHVPAGRRRRQPEEAAGEHSRHPSRAADGRVHRPGASTRHHRRRRDVYVAAICVLPALVSQAFRVPFQFGGTSLMIVVGVALETVNQIEAHLITRSYEGLTGPADDAPQRRRRT